MIIFFKTLKATFSTCLLSLFLVPLASGQLAPTTEGAPRCAAGDIRQPACSASDDGDFAANDLAIRLVHQFQVNVDASGQNILGDAANECVDLG